ncbi:hypothetical protein [Macellibacteroides fermentans]|uniref:hypothetical protein n=1 Tax=Macellibacteroides fermentans TaxID=879969 RepID=UPI00406C8937
MKAMIYCERNESGGHSFYLVTQGREYFLFNQKYRKGVQAYFNKGVPFSQAMNYSKTHNDSALVRTMTKLPMYIRYIEKEYEIEIFEQTKKHNSKCYHFNEMSCA